jgi:hypothetical protein
LYIYGFTNVLNFILKMGKYVIKNYTINLKTNIKYIAYFTLTNLNSNKNNIKIKILITYDFDKTISLKGRNGKLVKCFYINHSNEDFIDADIRIIIYNRKFTPHQIITFEYNYFLDLAKNHQINNMFISKSLEFLKYNISSAYPNINFINLDKTPSYQEIICFGFYQHKSEINSILSHSGNTILIWGGSDIKYLNDFSTEKSTTELIHQIKRKKNIFHISISKDITKMLLKIGICPYRQIHLSFVDLNKYIPCPKGNSVYIYSDTKRPHIYGQEHYLPILDWLTSKKIPYVINNMRLVSPKDMPTYYKQFFICLRFTEYDGNANTVQELGCMGIKSVHNGYFPSCLNWYSSSDIKKYICQEQKTIGQTDFELATKCQELISHSRKHDEWKLKRILY